MVYQGDYAGPSQPIPDGRELASPTLLSRWKTIPPSTVISGKMQHNRMMSVPADPTGVFTVVTGVAGLAKSN